MKTLEKKFEGTKVSGFLAIFIGVVIIACLVFIISLEQVWSIGLGIVGIILVIPAVFYGLLMVEPNETRVMIFFGKYKGTLTDNGFFWVNPFYSTRRIPIRARNLDIEPVKVNDKVGNPIMIGAVLVWRVKDTYKATFDIDSAGHSVMMAASSFVKVQSDAALRQVAGMYAYDNNNHETDSITLRSDGDEVSQKLEDELNNRLAIAGIEVIEARINYLAYAAEIASVMLRRQQADAIIAAREKIVEGAVSMVQLALDKLQKDEIVDLDEERKAAMVSNLLVVLCADEAAQPIVNAGTLHH
ncbi:regulator of protease activity HflC (stomatin/prohibitin superfamily) [Dysgonomonas sp. PFB1-18]|uniref:SPFH domain-containing protein n=1 Tax=unclassified Dysgonomonas TaxID=2630389 RepID=UPI0024769280|nr:MULTISPECIES: SPFH domain-containing protein [unclassified Dysgonomonas]MDH6309251.1 regulator of protease activity HflC (stomatin/prohibitin superfamily) [Dysgonomonas sp. PF1-14]MDH6338869.1 regulator of protease activity HflC (stomatin/prohibitin superfamily) [Dysgonomonas sp. PF1-16]MDH6380500.1 regulator of protease activity HflC (stomatin/prohibitin superfamily) [Dysgonomonas sp. PFB1-18]MDH6397697.1 regulator of protease activity HflC (stomatin/prohibitin superfamily) [Dysgonomonas sp